MKNKLIILTILSFSVLTVVPPALFAQSWFTSFGFQCLTGDCITGEQQLKMEVVKPQDTVNEGIFTFTSQESQSSLLVNDIASIALTILHYSNKPKADYAPASESPVVTTTTVKPTATVDLNDAIADGSLSVGLLDVQDLGGGGLSLTAVDDGSPAATATPEPGTMLLLGTGLAGIAGAARRRRRKNR